MNVIYVCVCVCGLCVYRELGDVSTNQWRKVHDKSWEQSSLIHLNFDKVIRLLVILILANIEGVSNFMSTWT